MNEINQIMGSRDATDVTKLVDVNIVINVLDYPFSYEAFSNLSKDVC